jgi:hypothetical protein
MKSLTAVALFLFLVPATPQTKPDFSGTWVLDVKKSSDDAAPESRLPPQTLVVRQTATELSFEVRSPGEAPTTEVFRLDREEKSAAPTEWKVRQATFVRNELALVDQYWSRPLSRTSLVRWSLSADRKVLTADGTVVRQTRADKLVTDELYFKRVYQRQ